MDATGLRAMPLRRPFDVRLFAQQHLRITYVLRVAEVRLVGLPRVWTFWVLAEAPEEVVIGMDLMWEWHVNSDPCDSRLYQLPPLPTGEGRSLYTATPERG